MGLVETFLSHNFLRRTRVCAIYCRWILVFGAVSVHWVAHFLHQRGRRPCWGPKCIFREVKDLKTDLQIQLYVLVSFPFSIIKTSRAESHNGKRYLHFSASKNRQFNIRALFSSLGLYFTLGPPLKV